MEKALLSPDQLQERMNGISVNYYLVDIWNDKESFYAQEDYIYSMIKNYDGKEIPKHWLLISGFTLVLIMEGNLKKATELIKSIPQTGYLNFLRLGLEIVNPEITWEELIRILEYLKQINASLTSVMLTAGRPSILNGFNDFSRIGSLLKKRKNVFIEDLSCMYEKSICPVIYNQCLAEYYYQIDKVFDASVFVSQTIKDFNKDTERRLLFAALYLQIKILLAQGKKIDPQSYITHVRNYVKKNGEAEFSYNIESAAVMLSLYVGKREVIAKWMNDNAPDEFGDFNMLDLYRYMVKMRCYIINQKYTAVVALAEKLRPLLEAGKRHMDLCELDLILTINFYRAHEKNLAFEALERALKIIHRHKYFRLIADEGDAIFPVLVEYMQLKGENAFLMSLIEITRRMAINYPLYMKSQFNNETFTQMEIDILKLLEQGKQKEDIAECFFISVNTVKYHLKNIYSKLGISTAGQAVWEARVLGII